MAKNGLHLITPTSIAYTGTSASISANGSVTFSAVSTLSLNGVFSADYDNYMIVAWWYGTANLPSVLYRLRTSGSDATGGDYANQYLYATGTSVTGARATSQTAGQAGALSSTYRSGDVMYFYGPYLSQPTAHRHVNVAGAYNAVIFDDATTHSLSNSYDGITLYPSVGSMTGRIAVYGMRK